jgi:hypothetical protein
VHAIVLRHAREQHRLHTVQCEHAPTAHQSTPAAFMRMHARHSDANQKGAFGCSSKGMGEVCTPQWSAAPWPCLHSCTHLLPREGSPRQETQNTSPHMYNAHTTHHNTTHTHTRCPHLVTSKRPVPMPHKTHVPFWPRQRSEHSTCGWLQQGLLFPAALPATCAEPSARGPGQNAGSCCQARCAQVM